MKFINLTPHAIHIIVEGKPTITIEPSGIIPRLKEQQEEIGKFEIEGEIIPVMRKGYGEDEGMPASHPLTVYIVSALLAQAMPYRDDLYIPNDTVRDEKGRIIGCKSFARI